MRHSAIDELHFLDALLDAATALSTFGIIPSR